MFPDRTNSAHHSDKERDSCVLVRPHTQAANTQSGPADPAKSGFEIPDEPSAAGAESVPEARPQAHASPIAKPATPAMHPAHRVVPVPNPSSSAHSSSSASNHLPPLSAVHFYRTRGCYSIKNSNPADTLRFGSNRRLRENRSATSKGSTDNFEGYGLQPVHKVN